jgi:hypothetical protein
MTKTFRLLSIAVLLVVALPFASAAQPHPRGADAGNHEAGNTAALLFYPLPEEALDGLEHRLNFVVTKDEVVQLTESLGFSAEAQISAGRPVVEILALHPQLLASWREGQRSNDIFVSIYLDGSLVEEDTIQALATKSLALRQQGVFPVDVTTRPDDLEGDGLRHFSAAITPSGCVNQCLQNFIACDNNCNSRPVPNCESRCDSLYYSCLHNCGCPVVTNQWTTKTLLSTTLPVPSPLVCLDDQADSGPTNYGHDYQRYVRSYKNEVYQTVAQCDGTTTQSIVNVYYTNEDCWKRYTPIPDSCIANPNYPPTSVLCTF